MNRRCKGALSARVLWLAVGWRVSGLISKLFDHREAQQPSASQTGNILGTDREGKRERHRERNVYCSEFVLFLAVFDSAVHLIVVTMVSGKEGPSAIKSKVKSLKQQDVSLCVAVHAVCVCLKGNSSQCIHFLNHKRYTHPQTQKHTYVHAQ